MEPIKVSVDVNINLSEDVKSFIAQVFNGIQALAPKPATTQASATQASATKPATTQAPAPKSAEQKSVAQASAEISIEDVRKALSLKVNSHRAEIKDKLTELGAPSVTKLDSAKYPVMLDFLNALD